LVSLEARRIYSRIRTRPWPFHQKQNVTANKYFHPKIQRIMKAPIM
jgi:hypothetical protein